MRKLSKQFSQYFTTNPFSIIEKYWGLIFDYPCLMFVVCSMHACWFTFHGSWLKAHTRGGPQQALRLTVVPSLRRWTLSHNIEPWGPHWPHMHQVSSMKVPVVGWGWGGRWWGVRDFLYPCGEISHVRFPTTFSIDFAWIKERSRG